MKKTLWLVGITRLLLSFGYAFASERLDEMTEQIEGQSDTHVFVSYKSGVFRQ